jgi:asparagine synthase (glutamine-hydrolysing)
MRALGVRPRTFSIGFDDPAFDELPFARLVAEKFGADHRELVVRPDAWSLAEKLALQLDEPFADVSAVPTYLVSQLAAKEVKVVLTGDGGDELFAGYDRYPAALRDARLLDSLPARARAALGTLIALLPEGARGRRWLRHASLPPWRRYLDQHSLFADDQQARLLTPDWFERLRHEDALGEVGARLLHGRGDGLARLLRFDASHYLPHDLLTKVDRMSMAHSLEARPPLLDHHLVEAVFRLPSSLKLAGSVGKWVFKRAFADLIPAPILSRQKRGFGVPIRTWFRGALGEDVIALLRERRTIERGLFDPRYVTELWREHRCGRRDQSLRMWGLLMFELWCRQALDVPARLPLEGDTRERAHA